LSALYLIVMEVFVFLGLMVSFVSNCNGSFCYFRSDCQLCI
jgi:hypothetical protein